MTWAEKAALFAAGAERARRDGNVVATIVLCVAAAECNAVARNLAEAEALLGSEAGERKEGG